MREQYEAGEIIPVYCPGVEQAADLLTKALPAARILELAAIWGLFEHCPEDPRQAEAVAADLPTHPQYPQIKLLFLLLAMVQIQSAKCQPELLDEEEGDVHQVELSTDLMFILLVGFVGIGFIAVWELAKWCLRRHSLCRIHSTAKQRKLQRLRDRTARAIEAELSARRQPEAGAPTRYFAVPEGEKLHRTKDCPAIARSSNLCTFEVCQRCHRRAPDHTMRSTG